MSQSPNQVPSNAVDITTLPIQQLSQLQQRLSSDLEHLSTSHTRLRSAQTRFKDCIRSIISGIQTPSSPTTHSTTTITPTTEPRQLLIPLTSSLYVPAQLSSTSHVLVDIGTGFYIEKTTDDAVRFYNGKVEDLARNMAEIESVVGGKTETLRAVEDTLRGKVLSQQALERQGGGGQGGQGASGGGGKG